MPAIVAYVNVSINLICDPRFSLSLRIDYRISKHDPMPDI